MDKNRVCPLCSAYMHQHHERPDFWVKCPTCGYTEKAKMSDEEREEFRKKAKEILALNRKIK